MEDLKNRVALVTGASRGIGAAIARMVAERGADVVVNYRSKAPRAESVAQQVRQAGRRALLARADLTSDQDVRAMIAATAAEFGHLDLLVLNASGGLEKDRPADYAHALNVTAQERMVEAALPLLRSGGRIVLVTSHLAHFYGQKPGYAAYEPIAASKYAGEQALRGRMELFRERGITLVVVSGDLIEGTITPRLIDRSDRGIIEARRAQTGALPTVEDFARAIVDACADPQLDSGATIFVGSTEW